MDNQTFESVTLGERVGFVYGPGEHPRNKVAKVIDKGTNRWGNHIKVRFDDGEIHTVHSFTTVGIGAYRLDLN